MRVGEHRKPAVALPPMGRVAALMSTYERTGMLERTVRSFLAATPGVPLTVFDDGSPSAAKRDELVRVEGFGVTVVRLGRGGFVSTWLEAFAWSRGVLEGFGGVVALEDDLSFAPGWLDVLRRMHDGAIGGGLMPGAMSCLRVHELPQGKVVELGGVEAYQSMGHSFQVNLFPMAVACDVDLLAESAGYAIRGRHGIDVHLVGLMSHRRGRTSFVSMRSWVAHEGFSDSVVASQGYRPLKIRGYELVEALRRG